MKVLPNPEAAYRAALEDVSKAYTFDKLDDETRSLVERIFREGWVASKLNTIEMLEHISKEEEDKNGGK